MTETGRGDCADRDDQRSLTLMTLLATSGEFDVESIRFLDFRDCGLEDLTAIEACTNLVRLDIRRNEVSVLRPLQNLKCLAYLNASGNRITNIDVLGDAESLVDINLAGNLIGNFARIECLRNIPGLQKLRFLDGIEKISNPICHNLEYENTVLRLLPNLVVLDGMTVRGRGSELFKLCKELDEQIRNINPSSSHGEFCPCGRCEVDNSAERTFGPVEERVIPGAWLKPGYFSLPAPNTKEDLATTEFREMLADCQKLNRSAKEDVESVSTTSRTGAN